MRSREELAESFGCDGGGPEVLAIKIAIFEWLDRKNGFDVRTPRIPDFRMRRSKRE